MLQRTRNYPTQASEENPRHSVMVVGNEGGNVRVMENELSVQERDPDCTTDLVTGRF